MSKITRRRFVGGAAALGLSSLGLPALAREAAGANPPNILLIISDQLNAYTIGAAGCDVQTPNIDRLAREGTWFRNATCTYPLCVPSRISMFTGVYPHQRDYFGNRYGGKPEDVRAEFAERNEATPLLWTYFAAAGYGCSYAGKWHLPVDPHDAEATGTRYIDERSRDRITDIVAEQLLDQIQEQPFFLTASYDTPHEICGWARGHTAGDYKYVEQFVPPPPEQCPALPQNFAEPADMPEALLLAKEKSRDIAYPTAGWHEGDWRQYVWAYRQFTEMLDGYVGRLLDALDRSGAADSTIVVFVADHGDGAAAHHWNQKTALWEECIRVPWIIRVPAAPKGLVNEAPVSSGIDMLPTMLALAGLRVPSHLDGQSLRPVVEGKGPRLREFSVSETLIGGAHGRCVRTGRCKYVAYDNGANGEQFFDLRNDPGEVNNLIGDPDAAEDVELHRQLLRRWCARTADQAFDIPARP